MKLDLKFEFVISDFGKEAYVYIIDQNNKDNKKCDVREKTQKISSLLFNFIISHDLDFFFFIDEINVFKQEQKDLLYQNIEATEGLNNYSPAVLERNYTYLNIDGMQLPKKLPNVKKEVV